jgi:hypothetical protein
MFSVASAVYVLTLTHDVPLLTERCKITVDDAIPLIDTTPLPVIALRSLTPVAVNVPAIGVASTILTTFSALRLRHRWFFCFRHNEPI